VGWPVNQADDPKLVAMQLLMDEAGRAASFHELDPFGERHLQVLRELLLPLGSGGNLTSDAHLAALAIEHQAELYSSDSDFARFNGLKWRNPLS
jgi:predicted nucleic acid-binding protein